ncbi:MAG: cobalamin-dependent protein [Deltaproteobacteria bacterium]|nr:cobalamin-dependent protein [Deltaproteobacteria bacterium]
MKIALIGPELEENLGLRYLHSSLAHAGHQARIFDFHEKEQIPDIAAAIIDYRPDLVGLSMVFTGRAREFLELADELRGRGFEGHVTAGGHFASFHASDLLTDYPALDSIVHGDGEEAIVELVESMDRLETVGGLTYRSAEGPASTPPRRNPDDLDLRPWPTRPERLHKYLGRSIVNMLGSRGCYGNCNYCSIYAWFKQTKGKRLRQRNVDSISEEMAALYHERGVRIFNFHDDNFFLADMDRNMERFTALQKRLDRLGMGRIALQVKARPDSVDREAFSLLKDMGLFRVFLGVESNAVAGLKTLGRRTRREKNHEAIATLRDLGIHTTFNLLLFDPETVLSDLSDNIDFMSTYSDMPLNFGRVEVYSGTPLERSLRLQGRLLGSYLGYSYRISDARVQRAFEMYRALFLPRNFRARGTSVLAMRVDYYHHLLAHFLPHRSSASLDRRVKRLITSVNRSSAEILTEIQDFVSTGVLPSADAAKERALELAEWRESFDERITDLMDDMVDEIQDRSAGRTTSNRQVLAAAASAGALVLAVTVTACKTKHEPEKPLVAPPEKAVVEEPRPPPPLPEPTPPEPAQPAALTEEQVAAIEARIAELYQPHYNTLVEEYEYKDKKVTLGLVLDESGAVTSSEISVDTSVKLAEFEKNLSAMVASWKFDAPGHEASLDVTLEYVEPPKPKPKEKKRPGKKPPTKKPPDWHICEMMMEPINDLER